jgi:hypothetical protein
MSFSFHSKAESWVGGKIGYPKWPLADWLDSKCRFEHRRSSAAQKDGAA